MGPERLDTFTRRSGPRSSMPAVTMLGPGSTSAPFQTATDATAGRSETSSSSVAGSTSA